MSDYAKRLLKSEPAYYEEEVAALKLSIQDRLRHAANAIVTEEVQKILGRVKIITHSSLDGRLDWYIEKEKKDE